MTKKVRFQTHYQKGSIMVYVLVVMAMILIITGVTLNIVNYDNSFDNQAYHRIQAQHIAEAGVDWAIRKLNLDSNYTGETDTALGAGTMTIAISGSGASRTIDSYGYIPSSTNPIYKQHVRVSASINSNQVEFFYGLQVDGGGLTMANNSHVYGNVYSNGSITGGNASSISGDAVVAGGLTDQPTVSWTSVSTDQFFADSNSDEDIAQSFTATASDRLNKVSVYLGKVGNPTSNITVHIAPDNGNKPSTTSLADSSIPYTSVGTTPGWIDVTFASPTQVTNNTKYWIVLDYNASSATNHWDWLKDNSDGYPANTGKYTSNCCSGNPTWTNFGGDLGFRAWIGGVITNISGLTIGSATSGTGHANQFLNDNIHGSNCPNQYCIVENPPPTSMPISDGVIQDWKNFAATGGTQAGYTLNSGTGSLGPKEITGDLTIGNGATLNLTGTLWVTGNISLSNNCTIALDPNYGDTSGVIITDGTVTISNGCNFTTNNSTTNILLLSTLDAKTTVSMNVANNSNGVFYYAAKSLISFSNNATAQEATAWGIQLNPNASVTYQSGFANSFFSAGPGGGWQVNTGTWRLSPS